MERRGPSRLYKFPIKSNNYHKCWYDEAKRLIDVGIKFDYRLVALRNIKGDYLPDVQGVNVTFETGADYTYFLLRFGNEQLGLKDNGQYHVYVGKSHQMVQAGEARVRK